MRTARSSPRPRRSPPSSSSVWRGAGSRSTASGSPISNAASRRRPHPVIPPPPKETRVHVLLRAGANHPGEPPSLAVLLGPAPAKPEFRRPALGEIAPPGGHKNRGGIFARLLPRRELDLLVI